MSNFSLSINFQIIVGAPNDHKPESVAKIRASIAKLVGESCRNSNVIQLSKTITEDRRIIEIQKVTRNPFILILDKVCTKLIHR